MSKPKGPWRDRWGHFVARVLSRKQCPHVGCRARAMTDDQLVQHLTAVHDYDTPTARAMIAELDKRDRQRNSRQKAAERGKSRRAQERDAHEVALEAAYIAAEHETRGHMVNKAGQRAGIDPRTLWTGTQARADKYASDELKEWFDKHGRLTRTDFRRHSTRHGGREQAEYEDEVEAQRRRERARANDRLYGQY